jgi:hypothetical protein
MGPQKSIVQCLVCAICTVVHASLMPLDFALARQSVVTCVQAYYERVGDMSSLSAKHVRLINGECGMDDMLA